MTEEQVTEARMVPIRHEVGCVRKGRPGYRWANRYLIEHADGTCEYPPITRTEAIARLRELNQGVKT